MQISVGQNWWNLQGLCGCAGCWFLQWESCWDPLQNRWLRNCGYSPLCDWYWWPLLFLVPSYLCSPQLCQFLGGVKPKWVLHVMPWKAGQAGCWPAPPFSRKLSSWVVLSGSEPCWPGWVGWCRQNEAVISFPFWVLLRFLVLLCYSGLTDSWDLPELFLFL